MEYSEDNLLMISGIQHFAFCRRQWALIHIEQQWQENIRTIEGEILHERAHDWELSEKRHNIIVARGIAVISHYLGVYGKCDVVEFHRSDKGVKIHGREGLYLPVPIEYKRGKPKEEHDADELQLCVQAMCLEEMLSCRIDEGYLFYGETNHRLKIEFTSDLRGKVKTILKEMHELYNRRHTPKVRISKSCKACSLTEICLPKLCKNQSAIKYIQSAITENFL